MFAGVVLAMTPFLMGQQPQNPGDSRSPEDVFSTRELVMWSYLQKPQPIPQPLPPPDKSMPQPDQRPVQGTNQQSSAHDTAQTFVGKIVKSGDRYILKASGGTSYRLDDQSGARQYEDKDVRVSGTLDSTDNTIHVAQIELLS
jgi:hypothetical protein